MLDWDSALEQWRSEAAATTWVTLAEAEQAAGVSRSALRNWYRDGEVASRMERGPHGDQRLVPLDAVLARAARTRRGGNNVGGTTRGQTREGAAEQDLAQLLIDQLAGQFERAEARADRAEAKAERAEAKAERAESALREALSAAAATQADLQAARAELRALQSLQNLQSLQALPVDAPLRQRRE